MSYKVLEDSCFKYKFWWEGKKRKIKKLELMLSAEQQPKTAAGDSLSEPWEISDGCTADPGNNFEARPCVCLLWPGVAFGRGEKEVQSKNLGTLERCLEWGMDKALPAVLTLAVCIYDNWKLINLSKERMWKTNWKSLALRFVLSCQGHFGLLESNVREGGLISEIFLL